jgi:hypothetical protein
MPTAMQRPSIKSMVLGSRQQWKQSGKAGSSIWKHLILYDYSIFYRLYTQR